MSPQIPIRLDYERPPLIEQAVSLAFAPLIRFSLVDYGLFWAEISDQFPHASSDTPLENPTENFDEIRSFGISFNLLTGQPLPRGMFRNDGGELLQLQPDRFGFNWAKEGGGEYPHSEAVMTRFFELYDIFERFVSRRALGDLDLRQCELTNLNVIPVSDFGQGFHDMTKALNVDPLDLGMENLVAETYVRNRQHRILGDDGKPIGRLHTSISPVISSADNSHAFRLEFTARSAVNVTSIEQAKSFFAVARNSINRAFEVLVADTLKAKWGKTHG